MYHTLVSSICFLALGVLMPVTNFAQWAAVNSAGITSSSTTWPTIAFDPAGSAYLACTESNSKLAVRKFNGYSWNYIGTAGFSAGSVNDVNFLFDQSGTPYVAYNDGGNSNKATVMKYNGSSWVNVGSAGFSDGTASMISLALDDNDLPYVAYSDGANSSKVTVKKFDGSSWVSVGGAVSSLTASYPSIAIAADGTPYVAYTQSKCTVKKYDGSNWVTVGSANFSAGAASYTNLIFDSNGTLYVAYRDDGNSSKATVMKYNGSSWVNVGSAGFSAGVANYLSFALSSTDVPYITYQDMGNSGKATVMKYNGSNWVNVGSAGFSAGNAFNLSIALNKYDIPFVAYEDDANSSKATVMANIILWTGFSGTSWTNAGNWSGGVPTSTDDIWMPSNCVNYPSITSLTTPAFTNMYFDAGASISVGTGGVLNIYGSIINEGGTITATSGKVKMMGTSTQTIAANTFSSNTIMDLEIDNSAGVTLGGTLGITGTLTPTSGTFTTGGYLTLKSSASGTARIAAGSGSYLSGTVTIERYIPGGKRTFRFIGNPTTSTLTLNTLQDNIYITGSGGVTNGFDATQTQNPSAFWFDNTATSPGVWTAITNTTTDNSWTTTRGIRVLVRGDRTQPTTLTGINPTPNAVTLDVSGTLKTGDQNISLTSASGKYHLLANPYASPLDIGTVLGTASNIGTLYWVWDAQSGTRGAYVTKLKSGGAYSIPSMSAFMVQPTASSVTLAFTESNKASAESGGNNFFRGANTIPDIGEFKLMYNGYASDNIFIRRDSAAQTGFDVEDGKKLWNPDMSIYFVSTSGDSLSLDSRPFNDTVTVPLGFITNVTTGATYGIRLDSWGIAGYTVYIKDKLLNTLQVLNSGDEYMFATTTGTVGASRFDIVMKPNNVMPVSAITLSVQQKSNDILLQWIITGTESGVQYAVEYSKEGKSFEQIASQQAVGAKQYSWLHKGVNGTDHYYRIRSTDADGKRAYSSIVKISTGKTSSAISIYPNPVRNREMLLLSFINADKGNHSLQLSDAMGRIVWRGAINHPGGSAVVPLSIPSLQPGNYLLNVMGRLDWYTKILVN